MQIGAINPFLNQITSLFKNKNTNESSYSPPSPEVLINSVFEKLSIDKKAEARQQEVERTLTGFGKEADETVKRASQAAAEIYRAVLEGELKNKIDSMASKEQASKLKNYIDSVSYKDLIQSNSLSLYS